MTTTTPTCAPASVGPYTHGPEKRKRARKEVMCEHAPRVWAMAQRILEDLHALVEIEAEMATESPCATFGVTGTNGIKTVWIFFDGLRQNAERRLNGA
jgi:hypothetical protein